MAKLYIHIAHRLMRRVTSFEREHKAFRKKNSSFRKQRYCLGKIWDEFKIIIVEELQLDHEMFESILEKVLKCLAKNIAKKDLKENEYKIPSLIQYLEKETGYSNGKGEKSSSFISLFEDMEEKEVEKYTKSHEEEGPRLILFLKGKDQLEMTVIATDNCRIYCQTENVINSIMILLASYYVFNLDYSRKYSQCLGFLQQYVLVDAFTSEKSLKYWHFVKKIANDLVE